MKNYLKDFAHYLPLMVVLTFGIVAFWRYSFNEQIQVALVVFVSVFYVIWGIIHHAVHKDLFLVVVIEYIAVAFLGAVAVLALF